MFLGSHAALVDAAGRRRVVRNGYLPERFIQTGIGPVSVRQPRVRDRGDGAIRFTSAILPRYLRRAKSLEDLLPWLYLKGISTGDFGEALAALLGSSAPGLVRDRGDGAIRFTSAILPRYLRRAKSLEDLLPWLYLKGISTGDFGEALAALLGSSAPGLSASTITRLKEGGLRRSAGNGATSRPSATSISGWTASISAPAWRKRSSASW